MNKLSDSKSLNGSSTPGTAGWPQAVKPGLGRPQLLGTLSVPNPKGKGRGVVHQMDPRTSGPRLKVGKLGPTAAPDIPLEPAKGDDDAMSTPSPRS